MTTSPTWTIPVERAALASAPTRDALRRMARGSAEITDGRATPACIAIPFSRTGEIVMPSLPISPATRQGFLMGFTAPSLLPGELVVAMHDAMNHAVSDAAVAEAIRSCAGLIEQGPRASDSGRAYLAADVLVVARDAEGDREIGTADPAAHLASSMRDAHRVRIAEEISSHEALQAAAQARILVDNHIQDEIEVITWANDSLDDHAFTAASWRLGEIPSR